MKAQSWSAVVVAVASLAACGKVPDAPAKAAGTAASTTRAADAPAPLPKPPTAAYQRDLYAKLEDCVADWAFAGRCVPLDAGAPERARGAAFVGPIYSNALRFEAQMALRREAFDQGYIAQVDESPSNRAIATSEVRS